MAYQGRSRAFALAKLLGPSNAISNEYIQPALTSVTESINTVSQSVSTLETTVATTGGGSENYATASNLPLTGNEAGDMAFVQETNRLYIWNGSGWYNIALINTNPSIVQGADSDYILSTDGTPTVISLIANDPEGVPISWDYEVTSGSLTNGGGTTATIEQDSSVFTITPSTNTNYGGNFELTFKASDGVNIATNVSQFVLKFIVQFETEQAIITGSGVTNIKDFGTSAALSGDGNILVASDHNAQVNTTEPGAIFIFERTGTTWQQLQVITSPDTTNGAHFGSDVAISDDGNTIAVCLPITSRIYVYFKSGATWNQQAILTQTEGLSTSFGTNVSISGDGNTIVAGAPNATSNGLTSAGAAYVFVRSGSSWSQQARLVASDVIAYDYFGSGAALNSDGNTLVITTKFYIPADWTTKRPHKVFTRSGTTWTEEATIIPANPVRCGTLPTRVALSGDGNTAILAAEYASKAYVFNRSGTTWTESQVLTPSDGMARFGNDVSISSAGDKLVVGSWYAEPGGEIGTTYIFQLFDSTWIETLAFRASDAYWKMHFGVTVSMSADGNTVAVGANGTKNNVYIYI